MCSGQTKGCLGVDYFAVKASCGLHINDVSRRFQLLVCRKTKESGADVSRPWGWLGMRNVSLGARLFNERRRGPTMLSVWACSTAGSASQCGPRAQGDAAIRRLRAPKIAQHAGSRHSWCRRRRNPRPWATAGPVMKRAAIVIRRPSVLVTEILQSTTVERHRHRKCLAQAWHTTSMSAAATS